MHGLSRFHADASQLGLGFRVNRNSLVLLFEQRRPILSRAYSLQRGEHPVPVLRKESDSTKGQAGEFCVVLVYTIVKLLLYLCSKL